MEHAAVLLFIPLISFCFLEFSPFALTGTICFVICLPAFDFLPAAPGLDEEP